jgi:hypothetical protein
MGGVGKKLITKKLGCEKYFCNRVVTKLSIDGDALIF